MMSGTRSTRQGWAALVGIGEQVVRDAGLPHPRIELLHAQRARRRVERAELVQQRLPVPP